MARIFWGEHSERLYCGVAAFYRNAYESQLVQSWLTVVQGRDARLRAGARVADVGCGYGISTIQWPKLIRNSRFWAFDYHAESIEAARQRVHEAGVADRTTFEVATAKNYPGGPFDVICFFDCLHDLGDPWARRGMRAKPSTQRHIGIGGALRGQSCR